MAQFLSLEIEYVTLILVSSIKLNQIKYAASILMSTIELQILSFVLKFISDMKDVYANYK